ncbi:MAG: helix-turn-helix domain-containing protein [Lachnospiraceae bacterium]|nr:helix-turn-helix domain-containing protein [Lachnospiraceae bacterium]
MNLERLDYFLRKENAYEADPNADSDYSNISKLLPFVHDVEDPDSIKLAYSNAINASNGVIASKQDRHHAVEEHSHDWLELAYMYSGEAHMIIAGQPLHLHQGECVLINYNTPHSCQACDSDDILINLLINRRYLRANFFDKFADNSILSKFLMENLVNENKENGFIYFQSGNNRRLPIFINEFLCEYYDKGIHSAEYLSSFATLIFLELADIYKDDNSASDNNNHVLTILRYIEGNYNNCTLKSTAEFFHMNPNYLSGYIRKNTGKTFKELIQEQRMNLAVKLLENSNLTISEISQQVGYENVSFFYKLFNETFGISPATYRNSSNYSEP